MGKKGRLTPKIRRARERRFERTRQDGGIEHGQIIVGERRGWIGQLGSVRVELVQAEDGLESDGCGN